MNSLEKSLEFLLSHQQGNLFELLCHHFVVVAIWGDSNTVLVFFLLIAKVVDDSLHRDDVMTFLNGLLSLR